ncbi:hypothetical protein RQP46_011258 [Phenoliferia psychrophenolica]
MLRSLSLSAGAATGNSRACLRRGFKSASASTEAALKIKTPITTNKLLMRGEVAKNAARELKTAVIGCGVTPGREEEERIALLEAKLDVKKDIGTVIYAAVVLGASSEEQAALAAFLAGKVAGGSERNVGAHSINWRLGLVAMAAVLTTHLVESSLGACFAALPVFTILIGKVQPLNLQLIAESPLQALLGIPVPEAHEASATLLITIGDRREKACRALTSVAWDKSWEMNVLQGGGPDSSRRSARAQLAFGRLSLDVLIGLAHFMILEHVRFVDVRWLLRCAIGVYTDVLNDSSEEERQNLRRNAGPLLIEADAALAAITLKPALQFELSNLRDAGARLAEQVDRLRGRRISLQEIKDTLSSANAWLPAIHRRFALLASGSTALSARPEEVVRLIWEAVDAVHSAVQQFQLILVNLDYIHAFVKGQMSGGDLDRQRRWQSSSVESEQRLRKCLKLYSFYYQVSEDL